MFAWTFNDAFKIESEDDVAMVFIKNDSLIVLLFIYFQSPNLPKKFDKFANYMKNNMKVTDKKVR